MGAALAFSYAGSAAFVDLYAWFDSWAFLALLASMVTRNAALAFLAGSLAAWTDERAAVALGLAYAFHLLPTAQAGAGATPVRRSAASGVLAAAAVYVLGRLILGRLAGVTMPVAGIGIEVLRWHLSWLGLGAWTFLEGLWIPLLAALWCWRDPAARRTLAVALLVSIVLVAGAFSVVDLTRSGAYLFPWAFLALRLLRPRTSLDFVRGSFFVAALVSLIFPDHNLQTGWQMPWVLRALFSWTPFR